MPNKKENNYGLQFDLPDYQGIEAILDEMVEKENSFREKYNDEKIRIDKIRRERQALNSSGIPKESETYMLSDAEIRRKESELTEKYNRLRQKTNATKQPKQAPYAPRPQPKAPSYSVNTGESKPTRVNTKSETNYQEIAGWMMGAGALAIVAWGGMNIVSSTNNFLAENTRKENAKNNEYDSYLAEYNESIVKLNEIGPILDKAWRKQDLENHSKILKEYEEVKSRGQNAYERLRESKYFINLRPI